MEQLAQGARRWAPSVGEAAVPDIGVCRAATLDRRIVESMSTRRFGSKSQIAARQKYMQLIAFEAHVVDVERHEVARAVAAGEAEKQPRAITHVVRRVLERAHSAR